METKDIITIHGNEVTTEQVKKLLQPRSSLRISNVKFYQPESGGEPRIIVETFSTHAYNFSTTQLVRFLTKYKFDLYQLIQLDLQRHVEDDEVIQQKLQQLQTYPLFVSV